MLVIKACEYPHAIHSAFVSNPAHAVYEDLPHPPDTIVGPDYAFRTVDGSGNNPCMPDLGKAGTPYSRSVQQIHPLPTDELPDAGLLFDTLLRRDKVTQHTVRYCALSLTSKSSSLPILPACPA